MADPFLDQQMGIGHDDRVAQVRSRYFPGPEQIARLFIADVERPVIMNDSLVPL
jgi:hypothetical protein